jgi:hypothetical protein
MACSSCGGGTARPAFDITTYAQRSPRQEAQVGIPHDLPVFREFSVKRHLVPADAAAQTEGVSMVSVSGQVVLHAVLTPGQELIVTAEDIRVTRTRKKLDLPGQAVYVPDEAVAATVRGETAVVPCAEFGVSAIHSRLLSRSMAGKPLLQISAGCLQLLHALQESYRVEDGVAPSDPARGDVALVTALSALCLGVLAERAAHE